MFISRPPSGDILLGELLKRVSRSFYLSLRVLPDGMRVPVSLAYLLARTADTIADTPGTPEPERLVRLQAWRALVGGARDAALLLQVAAARGATSDPAEAALFDVLAPALELLESLPQADAASVRQVVQTLTDGMVFDLRRFEGGRSGAPVALATMDDLDLYTYLVAGCVGEFWTDVALRHRTELAGWSRDEMARRGIAYGQALQLTNVLRDASADLAMGRCYLPLTLLSPLGLAPVDLLDARRRAQALPVRGALASRALGGYRQAADYVLAVPSNSLRLRLASLWPLMLGLGTLKRLAREPGWLDPRGRVKVPRSAVYGMLLRSLPTALSDAACRRWIEASLDDTGLACSENTLPASLLGS